MEESRLLLPKFDIQRFRESTDVEYRGNRRWNGNWGKVWVNGDLLFEISAFECKVTADREDVIIGQSKDSKIVSLTGEGKITIKRVFNRGFKTYMDNLKAGHDVRYKIVAAVSDPDAIRGQTERISIENVWFSELDIMHFTKGEVIEIEVPFGFTPEDLSYLETVEL